MSIRTQQIERLFKTIGVCSPYLAVVGGVFLLKNAFAAVFFYHLVLLSSVIILKKSKILYLLRKGFHPVIGPLLCLGAVLPGVVIYFCWPIAGREGIELAGIFSMLDLGQGLYVPFALYACLVNPFLEEGFWRGCFDNHAFWPNGIDLLFAGYHGLAVFPVLKIPFVFLVFAAMVFVGWLFRSVYRVTGGLLIPLLMHIIADVAIFCAIWMLLH